MICRSLLYVQQVFKQAWSYPVGLDAYASSEADETARVLLADEISMLARMHFLSACYQENNKLTPVVRLKMDKISNMITMIVNMRETISKAPSSQT